MSGDGVQPLFQALAAKKHAVIQEWLTRTLQTYPEHTSRFLLRDNDPFRNPVGQTLKAAYPALFDQLVEGMDAAKITPILDGVVRIRAVQDFSASQAVAFVFLLKKVLREELRCGMEGGQDGEALAAIEGRIDEMALLAFDLFMKCRERLYEIRANEMKRRFWLLERRHGVDQSAAAYGEDGPSEPRPCSSGLTRGDGT